MGAMLSDRALYTLGEVAHRFSTLEVEPSYSMSPFALDHLRQKFGVDMVRALPRTLGPPRPRPPGDLPNSQLCWGRGCESDGSHGRRTRSILIPWRQWTGALQRPPA